VLASGRAKTLAAGAIATFFLGVTPGMHDFWNMDDDQREGQQIHFLKNLALFGAALSFLAGGSDE
jgi:putative oxidoreductase